MAALNHVPLLGNVVPSRYSLFVQLAAAVLFASGLSRWLDHNRSVRTGRLRRVGLGGGWLALVLAFLTPALPLPSAPAAIPTAFGTGRELPIAPGTVVLTYPYPTTPEVSAMLWQAESGFQFRITGGEAAIPRAANGTPLPPYTPSGVEELFGQAYAGPRPSLNALTLSRLISAYVHRYRIGAVIMTRVGRSPGLVARALALDFGAPHPTGGVLIWHVRK